MRPFEAQLFNTLTENEFIINNLAIDYFFGEKNIVNNFIERFPFLLERSSITELLYCKLNYEFVENIKRQSVLITLLMLSGKCNANCQLCCTDRKVNPESLDSNEIKEILRQVTALGCKTIYVPGEGEPFFDPALFDLLQECEKLKMSVIVFTNGTIFSDDETCYKHWNMSSLEFIKELKKYPVSIYHKLWTFKPELLKEMMQFDVGLYHFKPYLVKGIVFEVPKGLKLLMDYFPRERIGIETMVESRNFFEFHNKIIPFVKMMNLHTFFEPIVHSGRAFSNIKYDLSQEQCKLIKPFLNRLSCKRLAYKIAIHNEGYLSFGITFNPKLFLKGFELESLNIRCENGIKDIFSMLHTNDLLVNSRYQIDKCMCEEACVHLSNGGTLNTLFEKLNEVKT